MGKYDAESNMAAEQTNADLADDMKGFENRDLSAAFPEPADQALIKQLTVEINKATSHNEKLLKMKEIGAKLTTGGLAALKDASKIAKAVFL